MLSLCFFPFPFTFNDVNVRVKKWISLFSVQIYSWLFYMKKKKRKECRSVSQRHIHLKNLFNLLPFKLNRIIQVHLLNFMNYLYRFSENDQIVVDIQYIIFLYSLYFFEITNFLAPQYLCAPFAHANILYSLCIKYSHQYSMYLLALPCLSNFELLHLFSECMSWNYLRHISDHWTTEQLFLSSLLLLFFI